MRPMQAGMKSPGVGWGCVGRFVAPGQSISNRGIARVRRTQCTKLFCSQDDLLQPKGIEQLLTKPSLVPSEDFKDGIPQNGRYLPRFAIYKKSGALNIHLIKPIWKSTTTGSNVVARQGSLFIEFARSQDGRIFDWDNKKAFAVSPLEVARILDDPTKDHELFHDTNISSTSQRGLVSKVFKITMTERGCLFSLRVKQRDGEWFLSVPLSRAEYKLIRMLAEYAVPFLMGFSQIVNEPPSMEIKETL